MLFADEEIRDFDAYKIIVHKREAATYKAIRVIKNTKPRTHSKESINDRKNPKQDCAAPCLD